MISSDLLPMLPALKPATTNTDISAIGVVLTYGSRNFLRENDVVDLKAESVTLVMPRESLAKFLDSAISEDELVAASKTFLVDRDANVVRRITLSLK